MSESKSLSLEEKRRLAKDLLAARNAEERGRVDAPIAVIGMGCRYPGGIQDLDTFWRVLEEGIDAITPVPSERWDATAVYDPDPDRPGKTNARHGGFVDGFDRFDAGFFNMSPRETKYVDPQQRLLLETSYEAIERAGIPVHSLIGSRTGVYVGVMWHDYEILQASKLELLNGQVKLGSAYSLAAGRISYLLGLQGPSIAVDTACSSSLVTVHLACQALRARECDLALAGGATLLMTPALHVEFAKLHGLAPDGRCKSFSAAADGVGWSDGCGMLVLKRLDDALASGDPIWGVIRSSAVNQDGRSNGLTAPNGPAQELVLKQAIQRAGITPAEVDYVEAHGTGTPLGDPIEAVALAAVYGDRRAAERPLLLGSVKSNLGHTLAASGVAGLIKVLLALRHQRLPASLHAASLNPHVPWDQGKLRLVRQVEPWLAGTRPRIAGVSSFGISGTNAHVILSEPPPVPQRTVSAAADAGAFPIVLSAKSACALATLAQDLARYLDAHRALRLADVANTLCQGRSHLGVRMAFVVNSVPELSAVLRSSPSPSPPTEALRPAQVTFLCTGQGAQYLGMGRELYRRFAAFRDAFTACVREAPQHLARDLLACITGTEAPDIDQTHLTQPAIFAVGIALSALWRSFGVRPQRLLGHSVGEYVAACIAGVFSLADGMRLIVARGELMQSLCQPGTMVALEAAESVVKPFVDRVSDHVSIAAVNGPQQTVLAGDADYVEGVVKALGQEGVRSTRLPVSHAFHSPLMRPMLARFAVVARSLRYAAPQIPLFSNVTGEVLTDVADADYWVRHVLAPVRFAAGMDALYQAGSRVFLEIGPQPVLLGMAAACLPEDAEVRFLPSLRKGKDDLQVFLHAACALWTHAVDVDFHEAVALGRRVPMPTYPFERKRYLVDPPAEMAVQGSPTGHPLLGSRIPAAGCLAAFASTLSYQTLPWLGDHLVFDLAVMPGAALAEWVQAAANAALGRSAYRIAELQFERALVVPKERSLRAQALVRSDQDGIGVEIFTQAEENPNAWTRQANARLVPSSQRPARQFPQAAGEVLAPPRIYTIFEEAGLRYRAAFQAVRAAWLDTSGAVICDLALEAETAHEASRYGLHPALIDAALHSLVLSEGANLKGELFLPFAFKDVEILNAGVARARVRGSVIDRTAQTIHATVDVWDESGRPIVHIGRLECRRVAAGDLRPRASHDDLLFGLEWAPLAASAAVGASPSLAGSSVLLVSSGPLPPLGLALAGYLSQRGANLATCQLSALPAERSQRTTAERVVYLASSRGDGAAAAQAMSAEALALVQALSAHPAGLSRVLCVFERAQRIVPEDQVSPAAAAAWGLLRTWLVEQTGWPISLLDVASLARSEDATAVAAECWAHDTESQVALRAGQRYGARLQRLPRAESWAQPWPQVVDGAVLITGGLGGIGLLLARHLVEQRGVRRLLLLGRSEPSAGGRQAIAELRALGAEIIVEAVDVTQPEALARVLAASGPLSVVIHAAAVAEAALLPQLSPQRLQRVLSAKAEGAWNLHELTRGQPLLDFVLLSSVAAIAPEPGAGAYAAANAFLDGLAHHRRALGLSAHSINFGPWEATGMFNQLAAPAAQMLAREGVLALQVEQALAGFSAAVAHSGAQVAVLALDLDQRQAFYAGRRVPPLWQKLVRAAGARPSSNQAQRWRRPERQTLAAYEATVEALILTELRRALDLSEDAVLARDTPFMQLGVDSLVGIELRNQLARTLRIELSATIIWDHRCIRDLTAHVAAQVIAQANAEDTESVRESPAQPSKTRSDEQQSSRLARAAMRLHPEPANPLLFGIGGVLGGGTYLQDLAIELGPLQPFYTMSYPGLDNDEEPLNRIEELASYFLSALRLARPHGPYVLLGHSAGGIVALEMARRLIEAGESVIELILLDTWTKATCEQRQITLVMPDLQTLLSPFIEAGRVPEDVSRFRSRFERQWRANGEAVAHYTMPTFSGDVTLIVPEDDLFGLSGNIESWRESCPALKVRRAAGNHVTMVLPPHVRRTAHIIRGVLGQRPQPGGPTTGTSAAASQGVSPRVADVRLPLSLPQRWMWLLHALSPGSAKYNLFFGLRLRDALNLEAMRAALDHVFARHDALRLSFGSDGDEPYSIVHRRMELSLSRHDLSALSEADRQAAQARVTLEVSHAPFDLAQVPLARGAIVSLHSQEHVLLFCFPHLILDGRSSQLFIDELQQAYEAKRLGRPPALPDLPWQIADSIRWEREHLTEDRMAADRAYWQQVMTDLPPLRLPGKGQEGVRSEKGGVLAFVLDQALTQQLRELARTQGCSVYAVLCAGFAALLSRYCGQDEFALATAVGSRLRPELSPMIGCFINTVLLRFDLRGDISVTEHLRRSASRVVEALAHAALPLTEVVRSAQGPRSDPGLSLSPVYFAFEKALPISLGSTAQRWEPIFDTISGDVAGTTKFDLCLSLAEDGEQLRGHFIYAHDVFNSTEVASLAQHLTALLAEMASSPSCRVSALPMLSVQERQRLLFEWNALEQARADSPCLHELVLTQAQRTPERIALMHGQDAMTYRELSGRVRALAGYLHRIGVGPEVFVGVCLERSVDLIVALLAVLQAGGAYVPLDPTYPRERLRFMLDDSGARVVLTSAGSVAALGPAEGRLFIDVHSPATWDNGERAACERPAPTSNNLAYLIYTSGSTGTPKAVAIEHASAVELVRWARSVYPADVLDGVLASTSICFDLSVFEIFVPLAAGGRIVLVADALDLARLDGSAQVRLLNTVPAVARELLRLDALPASLRVINLAGEALSAALVDALYAGSHVERIYDLYGPSEDTTYSTYALRTPGGPTTIGRPISNTRVYILDTNLQPVPIGVSGEICIAGAGLARGYLGRPELSAERFVPDPFVPGTRMYRTGDRGRFRPDGNIEFLGRTDGQVKLRGFRIELGEVETALRCYAPIVDCAVAVREPVAGDARLVAYLVVRSEQAVPLAELRQHLATSLPSHMLPQHVVVLPALPRTQNGKLDRQALPMPDVSLASDADHVPPQPGMEHTIAGVFAEVLHLPQVGREAHFFLLGGHSLLAVQAASRLSKILQREVSPTELFAHPILRELAVALASVAPPPDRDGSRSTATAQKQAIKQLGRWNRR